MRWLVIALLVSVAGLLLAAAGVARHIWMQQSRLHSNPEAGPVRKPIANAVFDPVDDIDQDIEP